METIGGECVNLIDRRAHGINDTKRVLKRKTAVEIERIYLRCVGAQRLMTHPGVGALTALAFVLIIGDVERFQCGKHSSRENGKKGGRPRKNEVRKEN